MTNMDKLYEAVEARGPVCVGLDTDFSYLPADFVDTTLTKGENIVRFNKKLIDATKAVAASHGAGVPTVKPWNKAEVFRKLDMIKASKPYAVAMDIAAAGLRFMKHQTPPAGSKTVEELRGIIADAKVPFIIKGVMTARGAQKAVEAGASAIVISNHGGRVLDQVPATAEVLPEIAEAVNGRCKILVDGGIRTGVDVFKALALVADAVLIARPFVNAIYGAGAEGVQVYVDKLAGELADTMSMCGAHSLAEITRNMVRV